MLVAADDVTRGKPDPEPVLLALDELGALRQAGTGAVRRGLSLRPAGREGRRHPHGGGAVGALRATTSCEAEGADYYLRAPGDVLALRP